MNTRRTFFGTVAAATAGLFGLKPKQSQSNDRVKLSDKEQRFVEEYLKDRNGKEAAERAGYEVNSNQGWKYRGWEHYRDQGCKYGMRVNIDSIDGSCSIRFVRFNNSNSPNEPRIHLMGGLSLYDRSFSVGVFETLIDNANLGSQSSKLGIKGCPRYKAIFSQDDYLWSTPPVLISIQDVATKMCIQWQTDMGEEIVQRVREFVHDANLGAEQTIHTMKHGFKVW